MPDTQTPEKVTPAAASVVENSGPYADIDIKAEHQKISHMVDTKPEQQKLDDAIGVNKAGAASLEDKVPQEPQSVLPPAPTVDISKAKDLPTGSPVRWGVVDRDLQTKADIHNNAPKSESFMDKIFNLFGGKENAVKPVQAAVASSVPQQQTPEPISIQSKQPQPIAAHPAAQMVNQNTEGELQRAA